MQRFAKICFLLALPLLFFTATARADSTLSFVDGATVSGSLVFDATTNKITSFNFTSNAFGVTSVFDSSSPNAQCGGLPCVGIFSNPNGDEVLGFDAAQSYGAIGELDLVLSCGGVANCLQQASDGNSFAIVAGNCGSTCFSSQQWRSVPECVGTCTDLLAGNNYLNITDPPSADTIYTLTLSTTSTGTVYAGNNSGGGNNNGGGGNTNVPEPSTLALSALGVVGFLVKRARA